jgi:hypothetical protein
MMAYAQEYSYTTTATITQNATLVCTVMNKADVLKKKHLVIDALSMKLVVAKACASLRRHSQLMVSAKK